MGVTRNTIVKVDFAKIDEYESTLYKIKLGLETCKTDIQEQERALHAKLSNPHSGISSGPAQEYIKISGYREDLEGIISMVDAMIYAIQMYKEYYNQYGAYAGGELIFDAEEVEKILDKFRNKVWKEDWQDDVSGDSSTFNAWEKSIEWGIDGLENDRERAVKYNRSINGQLQHEMIRMTNIVKTKMDAITDNSSVYITNMKPLVDGVAINDILKAFDIDDINFQELQANTDVKGYVDSVSEAQDIIMDKFKDENGELTIESILDKLKKGVSLSNKEIEVLKEVLSRVLNAYNIDISMYIKITKTTEGIIINLTEEGYTIIYEKIEETLEIMHSQNIRGIYKAGDPEYIDIKNKGLLSDAGRYLEIGGFVIDGVLFLEGISRGDYSDAGGALGGLAVSLIGYGIINEWNISGWAATISGVIIGIIALAGSEIGESIGNIVESNKDWFGDGID